MSKARPDQPKVIPHCDFPYAASFSPEAQKPWFVFNIETNEIIREGIGTKHEALNWALFNLGFQP